MRAMKLLADRTFIPRTSLKEGLQKGMKGILHVAEVLRFDALLCSQRSLSLNPVFGKPSGKSNSEYAWWDQRFRRFLQENYPITFVRRPTQISRSRTPILVITRQFTRVEWKIVFISYAKLREFSL